MSVANDSYDKIIDSVGTALANTFDELDQRFDHPQAVRAYHPQDGGWAIDEILEHITLTSYFLLLVIRKSTEKSLKRAQTQQIEPITENHLEKLEPISDTNAFPWLRPEHMEPARAKSLAEVRETMREQQQECLEILAKLGNSAGSLHKVRMSVQDLGKLDVYQWLYFLAMHAKRHIAQIKTVENEYRQFQVLAK